MNYALDLIVSNTPTTAMLWKDELKGLLLKVSSTLNDFKSISKKLSELIPSHSESHAQLYIAIEEVMDNWIKDRCREATRNSTGIGHLAISNSDLPSSISSWKFPRASGFFQPDPELLKGKTVHDLTDNELIEYAINTYDFDQLDSVLEKLQNELEGKSIKSAADSLGSVFGLINRRSSSPLKLKMQKGRYVAEMEYYHSYFRERINSVRSLIPSVCTLEQESGISGLHQCLVAVLNEEERHFGMSRGIEGNVPSRTKLNSGGTIEVTFYKDKLKMLIAPEFFEAMISFIKDNTTHTFAELEK